MAKPLSSNHPIHPIPPGPPPGDHGSILSRTFGTCQPPRLATGQRQPVSVERHRQQWHQWQRRLAADSAPAPLCHVIFADRLNRTTHAPPDPLAFGRKGQPDEQKVPEADILPSIEDNKAERPEGLKEEHA
jgi:hypothetical protein